MIIWIVSYPKSGNTLVRSMLSGLISSKLYGTDGSIDFNKLKLIPEFMNGHHFKNVPENNLSDLEKLSKYWIKVQEELNKNKKINFLKTHHARCSLNGNNFTNADNTAGAIYIVRDPRNVATSLKNYYNFTYEKVTSNMTNKNWYIYPTKEQSDKKIITLVSSWSSHFKSWTEDNSRLLLIKYEDLINDKEKELIKIINFIKKITPFEIRQEEMENCLKSSDFENMQAMEKRGDFPEASFMKKGENKRNFFNLGEKNDWKKILNREIREKIEFKFSKEMKELEYL